MLSRATRPPADGFKAPDWLCVLSCSVVTQAPPVEEENFDGKANLDMLSAVKYGKELLNEQLILQRYYVPAKKKKLDEKRGMNSVETEANYHFNLM